MEKVLSFLGELGRNNDREWFAANKARYREALERFDAFTAGLIAAIAAFDPTVGGLTPRDCTYRIYRDTRFSADKTPYKTYMGAYVCRGGKKSGYAGYYFHVDPVAGSLMTAGLYMPEPRVLKSVRYEIAENTGAFTAALDRARGFRLDTSNTLRRLPAGFDPDERYNDYLKLKDIYVEKSLDERYLLQKDLAAAAASDLALTAPLVAQLNRAAAWAFEEETDD